MTYTEEGEVGGVTQVAIGKWRREVHSLVECPTAVLCSTQARNLVLLQREFVVVGDLFVDSNGLLRVDHNLFLGLYGDNLGVAVWLKRESNEWLMGNSCKNERNSISLSLKHVFVEGSQTHSAAVVDEPGQVATLCGINNCVVVHSEQVAAPDALLCVSLLSIVSNHLVTQHTKKTFAH